MKKQPCRRLISLLLAAALLAALSSAAGAEGSLFFVAVNDTIPVTLTAQPYTSGGVVYVPYTAFDARPGGVVSAYDPTGQKFVLFTKDSRLVFDLASGQTSDENQNVSSQSAMFRNSLLYVPLIFCASHFGLKVSMLESKDGYSVLRFTTGSEVYDDSLFIEKAENLIAYRVAQQSAPTESTDTPQNRPDTPAQTPEEPEQEVIPATVYLAFRNAETMEETAARLAEYQLRAAFFLTADEVRENPALVRDLYAQGHVLGLTVDEGEPNVAEALEAANAALDEALCLRSQMALLPAGTDGNELHGYLTVSADRAAASVEAATENPEIPHLLLADANAAGLLAALSAANVNIRLLRETSILS